MQEVSFSSNGLVIALILTAVALFGIVVFANEIMAWFYSSWDYDDNKRSALQTDDDVQVKKPGTVIDFPKRKR